ncbi:hypothetical protein AAFF_G00342460 [Aldrovandia affinis]|uniref:B30.2/SPRY domain-containing protein n=1 Tax=Aldrovandia affinis TaxID=143900 RepID=A0AAD7VZW0_9TELE|nr:hypothetical protein AAFF_G00342460 [Aldrovandia affinis]
MQVLKKSASRKEQEEKEKEPSVAKEIPGIKGENEKDASSEKGKKRGFLFKAKKAAMITPALCCPPCPIGGGCCPRRPGRPRDHPQHHHLLLLFADLCGQEPSGVWVGWVTPDYHQYDPSFDLSKVRNVTVTVGDDKGNIHDSMKHNNCYMVWAGEFINSSQQGRFSQEDLLIGCLVDLATGLMTFTANGKEVNTFYQVEPNTKLFPAVFAQPSSQNMLQVELGKLKYYYSLRIFAGQEPSGVWVGWVTPDYHQYDPSFDLSKVRNVTVTVGDDKGNIHDSMKHNNCYMVWAGEFINSSQQGRFSQEDLLIGCLVDLATGLMTFTANGKEVNTFYQVEPNTKLFPAVFAQPSSQNMLQVELGKLKNIMPISAAMFRSERMNPVPQCPPRLDVQMLTPVIWSRMPNHFLSPEVVRVSERHGWAVECTEPLTMMALHIPEENRCIDVLELSERLDLLKFHYHTLMLYCAVCALGNNRVAHALCSHVDESQLLRQRARLLTNKEFIVPMTAETLSITLFPDGDGAHALPGVGLTTCLRPKLHFSHVNFVGTDPDLYTLSPVIPLEILKVKAISMLTEAVTDGTQAMRDPVGGSVEFHFVPILKLVSTLLIMGIFEDDDVKHILKMIEPSVFSGEKGEEGEEEEGGGGRGGEGGRGGGGGGRGGGGRGGAR